MERCWRRGTSKHGLGMPDIPDTGTISHFPLSLIATTAMEQALAKAMHRHLESMANLQHAVEACVGELRDRGLPPEAMLITMKAFIRNTAASHPPPGALASSRAADAYMDEMVRWSIVEYYRRAG